VLPSGKDCASFEASCRASSPGRRTLCHQVWCTSSKTWPGDWRRLDERIEGLSNEIEAGAHRYAGCDRLISAPGIGPLISSATAAAIGTGDVFSKGRDFAA
jgi:hypothetical protein